MVDQDGSVNFSRVVSVELPNAKSGLLFYPNPANTSIFIKTTDDATTDFDVTITDVVGKI